MDGFAIGFIGRSSTWNLLRGLVFPEHVGLRYIDNEGDCLGLDLVLVEDYMVDLVHCPRVYALNDRSVDGIIEAIVRGLGLGELNIGIDIGDSRCGVIILVRDTPIIHATLSFARLVRLVRRLSKYSVINIIAGRSPSVSHLLRDFLELLGDVNIRVKIVDEELVNTKKVWFKDRYPYLTLDELDGLVYAYAGLASI